MDTYPLRSQQKYLAARRVVMRPGSSRAIRDFPSMLTQSSYLARREATERIFQCSLTIPTFARDINWFLRRCVPQTILVRRRACTVPARKDSSCQNLPCNASMIQGAGERDSWIALLPSNFNLGASLSRSRFVPERRFPLLSPGVGCRVMHPGGMPEWIFSGAS